MKNPLQKFASGRAVLVLFIITSSVYAWMVLFSIPSVTQEAPELTIFDMSPTGYSLDQASHLLEAIGERGRENYLLRQLPVDLLYPGLFAATFTLLLIWLLEKIPAKSPVLKMAIAVPILAGLFDYLENLGIYLMLIRHPDLARELVLFSSSSTVFKSLFTVVFYLLLIYVLAQWGLAQRAGDPGRTSPR